MPDQPQQPGSMKPTMPQVPGVPLQKDAPKTPLSEIDPTTRLVLAIALIVLVGGTVAYFVLRPAGHTQKDDRFAAAEATAGKAAKGASAAAAGGGTQPTDAGHTSGGSITTEELAAHWSFRQFTFRRGLNGEIVPAMVIRLPEGNGSDVRSYWAFSLKDPFGSCQLEFVTDLDRISTEYGFQARHPMLVNSCNRGVYDPLQMFNLPTGAWVRGAVVHGSALRPPFAIEIRIEADQIIPVQME